MAWETGTAANHIDLVMKIRDFLTGNSDLVASGENWALEIGSSGLLTASDSITLRGPGLTGTDNIYCGIDTTSIPDQDIFNVRLWGHSGFDIDLDPHDQPLISNPTYLLTWDQPMTYWIIANGRRWMVSVKVSTAYSTAYVGFFIPYAAPSEYPFPMVVAAMSQQNERWSSESNYARFMADPGWGAFQCYFPDNVWRPISNYINNPNASSTSNTHVDYGEGANNRGFMFPTREYDTSPSDVLGYDTNSTGPWKDLSTLTEQTERCFDGTFIMRDLVIVSSAMKGPYTAVMGILDGAYWVPGRGNSSENTISKDSVDHIVFQNLNRTSFKNYIAMRFS